MFEAVLKPKGLLEVSTESGEFRDSYRVNSQKHALQVMEDDGYTLWADCRV